MFKRKYYFLDVDASRSGFQSYERKYHFLDVDSSRSGFHSYDGSVQFHTGYVRKLTALIIAL